MGIGGLRGYEVGIKVKGLTSTYWRLKWALVILGADNGIYILDTGHFMGICNPHGEGALLLIFDIDVGQGNLASLGVLAPKLAEVL